MGTSTASVRSIVRLAIAASTLIALGSASPAMALNLAQSPLFVTQSQSPLVMLTAARDHKLYYEAYNDYSDLDGNGTLDVGYKPAQIDYYGYFDSYKCYSYNGGVFTPATARKSEGDKANKKCTVGSGHWSGDFLNYVTMSRMDVLRKVLYGGYRSTDSTTATTLERTFIPQDAHAWGKEYQSTARDGYDIREYAPLDLPGFGRYHLFANVTLTGVGNPPLMRVLTNTAYRVWEWLSIERPVAGTQCATGANNRADCVGGGSGLSVVPAAAFRELTISTYNIGGFDHPDDHAEFDTLISTQGVSAHQQGSGAATNIDCTNSACNPFGTDENYLTVFKGKLYAPADGTYTFAVDGDDAVEVIIDGTVVAGFYGGHGFCNCTTHSGTISLTAGWHEVEFRHDEIFGGDGYRLYWGSGGTSAMTDYNVRVSVCVENFEEPNCKAYGAGTTALKPTGLLQKYGDSDGMYFGLISGSYAHNTRGGVLRKNIASINSEINSDGTFVCGPSATNCTPGIIGTFDRLRITSFDYGSHSYACGWITTQQMTDGQCEMWGNPIGEMVYETARYFAGKATPTAEFTYSGATPDASLGLPLPSWKDPYDTTNGGFPYCAKPYMLAISDVYPSFDSDQVPGSAFATFTGDMAAINATTLGGTVWDLEFGAGTGKNVFIGRSAATDDSAPTPKTANSFGNLRGLAPGEPTREGSFSAASMAYFAHINNLNPVTADKPNKTKMSSYSIALSSPFPTIEIPIARDAQGKISSRVTVVPFAKSDWGCLGLDASPTALTGAGFRPTNQIVDFYVESITDQTGDASTCAAGGLCPTYAFRINYEDVEQGADHDMDAIVRYTIGLVRDPASGGAKVQVRLDSDYAAGCIHHHIGYVISGTTEDGIYLDVRDLDTDTGQDRDYFLDTPETSNKPYPNNGYDDGQALPTTKTRTFSYGATDSSAVLLKDPLWYAAKFGGFTDANSNNVPEGTEWDADNDGTPDNYFLVVNPLKLELQLSKALDKIKHDASTASALATNSTSLQSNSILYQARFSGETWTGELFAFPILSTGVLGAASWEAHRLLQVGATRTMLTYDPQKTAGSRGIAFGFGGMTDGGYLEGSLNRTANGVVDNEGQARAAYLRAAASIATTLEFRTRPKIKNTNQDAVLGDIINSAIQYVGQPSFGLNSVSYRNFAATQRAPMIYVGANDGMLHGFSACAADAANPTACTDGGAEKVAYVPSEMYRKRLVGGTEQHRLSKLTQPDYGKGTNPHVYYVDGTPTVGDVCPASCSSASDWKTILVGGLNGGGQGIYALNITNPANFDEANASTLAMWEFNDWQDNVSIADNASDPTMTYGLGYTYSRPAIVQICTSRVAASTSVPKSCAATKWVVLFGNGYNNSEADMEPFSVGVPASTASTSGYAMLYVLDALTGDVIRKINTKAGSVGSPNGLATVAPDDADGDGVADYVYAGDLLGNMWKFDISSDAASAWGVAYSNGASPAPLYHAQDNSGTAQPITTAPEVSSHPEGGALVLFGTGKYVEQSDPATSARQTFYAIWDKGAKVATSDRSNLLQQSIFATEVAGAGSVVRTSTSHTPNWNTDDGWYMDLTTATSPSPAERVAFDPQLFGKIIYFPTLIPLADLCASGGDSWDYFLDAATGKALSFSVFKDSPLIDTGLDNADGTAIKSAASSRKSTVGITPTGTIISTGKGQGLLWKGGSTGEIEGLPVNLGPNIGRRVSWRELNFD